RRRLVLRQDDGEPVGQRVLLVRDVDLILRLRDRRQWRRLRRVLGADRARGSQHEGSKIPFHDRPLLGGWVESTADLTGEYLPTCAEIARTRLEENLDPGVNRSDAQPASETGLGQPSAQAAVPSPRP